MFQYTDLVSSIRSLWRYSIFVNFQPVLTLFFVWKSSYLFYSCWLNMIVHNTCAYEELLGTFLSRGYKLCLDTEDMQNIWILGMDTSIGKIIWLNNLICSGICSKTYVGSQNLGHDSKLLNGWAWGNCIISLGVFRSVIDFNLVFFSFLFSTNIVCECTSFVVAYVIWFIVYSSLPKIINSN